MGIGGRWITDFRLQIVDFGPRVSEQDWETCGRVTAGSVYLRACCAQTTADQEPHQYAEISHCIRLLWYNVM